MEHRGDGKTTFLEFAKKNNFRIYKQMENLGIQNDLHGEFFQEGIICLWRIYLDFGDYEDLVPAFANFKLRFLFSKMLRHYPDYKKRQGIFALNTSKESTAFPNIHIQNANQSGMIVNRWIWMYYHYVRYGSNRDRDVQNN